MGTRKRLWIESRIQGALARRIILHWLAFFVVAIVLTMVFQFLADPFKPLSEYWTGLWATHGPLLITMLLVLPAFLYDTIKLSNRFVGPVVRFRNSIRDFSNGKQVKPIAFRDDDFWQELADDFNKMLESSNQQNAVEPRAAEQQPQQPVAASS